MPVGIMQVLNNLNVPLGYRNVESELFFIIQPPTSENRKDRLLATSKSVDDTLPWYNPDDDTRHIWLLWGNGSLRLSEHNAQFRFDYQVNKTWHSKSVGKLSNGARYVLKFDPYEKTQGGLGVEITIFRYKDLFRTIGTHISRDLLEQLDTVVDQIFLPVE